jgi:hypothetical protein
MGTGPQASLVTQPVPAHVIIINLPTQLAMLITSNVDVTRPSTLGLEILRNGIAGIYIKLLLTTPYPPSADIFGELLYARYMHELGEVRNN